MFQSRWFDPFLQRAETSRPDIRRPRSLARACLIAASSAAVLAACSQPAENTGELPEDEDTGREVFVTAAFTATEAGARVLDFLPNADAASLGLIVAAPRDGGLDLFDADGAVRTRHAGPRLSGLATAPGFALRGEPLPLVFGSVAEGGTVIGYAIDTDTLAVFELPMDAITPADGIAGLCLNREGPGFVEIVVLGTGNSAEIWRVRDAGEATLATEQVSTLTLPAPARQCASHEGDIFFASPGAGVSRIDADGNLAAEVRIPATDLAVTDLNGSVLVLITDGAGDTIKTHYGRDLTPAEEMTVVDGLSTRGVGQPGAIAATAESYGYTAYSDGLIAVYDREEDRIKVISREAFSRAFFSVE